eukprot:4271792-Heterocapsa_arctica.AAC.1
MTRVLCASNWASETQWLRSLHIPSTNRLETVQTTSKPEKQQPEDRSTTFNNIQTHSNTCKALCTCVCACGAH